MNPRIPYGYYTISNRARSAGLRDFSECIKYSFDSLCIIIQLQNIVKHFFFIAMIIVAHFAFLC